MSRVSPLVLSLALVSSFGAGLSAALAAPSRIAVSNYDKHNVEIYALDGKLLAQLPVGVAPRSMAVRDGKLYVADRGDDKAPGSSISVIDLTKLVAERTIRVCQGCSPRALVFDTEGTMYVAGQAHQAVYWLRPPYDEVGGSSLVAWGWPMDLALFGKRSLVAVGLRGGANMAVVDGAAIQQRKGGATKVDVGDAPETVGSRPGTDEVWVSVNPLGGLGVIGLDANGQPQKKDIVKSISYPTRPLFTPDGKYAIVSGGNPPSMYVFDAEKHVRVSLVSLDMAASDQSISSDGKWIAVSATDGTNNSLIIVDFSNPLAPKVERRIERTGKAGGVLMVD